MAEGNVFSNLLRVMKEEGYNKDVTIKIGKVKSTTPLLIEMNGYEVKREHLFISDSLNNLINDNIGNLTGNIVKPNKKLTVGDKVLVLVENSDFYVIDRMV